MTSISLPANRVQFERPGARNKLKLLPSILLALPMLLLSAMMVTGGQMPDDPLLAGALLATWVIFNAAFFLMLFTGLTDRFRAPLFTLIALAMIITFSTIITSTRGSNALTVEDTINGRTPFCHMVIPMILVPGALTGTIIFPGSLLTGFASIGMMVVIWLGSSLVLGRGFCSWMCFYGGYDEGASRLARKPIVKWFANKHFDRRWIYFPFALLLAIVLISALTLSPTYCEWLCPFKAVTEYGAITSIITLVQTVIFITLFAGLVLVLPFLSKRRVQCGLFCPFGAMQSLTNKVNVFDVRIDTVKCSGCQKCVSACPTFSLDENSLKTGQTLITCTKCGKCVDTCTKGAINYHIKGTRTDVRPALARVMFLYPAFLLMVAFDGGTVAMALYRLAKLVTTGSML